MSARTVHPKCTRPDHPADPHFHYGYGEAYWSHTFPHWDINARNQRYTKQLQVHPDMDVDKGWES